MNPNPSIPLELLAPAGGMEQLRAAVRFGADAVYLAADKFGMRARAANFALADIPEAVAFAHAHGVKVHVACNILMHPRDIDELPAFFRALDAAGVDAFIIGDAGAFAVAGEVAPRVERHVSTQASVANGAAARVWHSLGATRVVCAREMSLDDIRRLREDAPPDLEIEAFAHGAMCMAVSGRCLISSYLTGRSGNQGHCTQPCRWSYRLGTAAPPPPVGAASSPSAPAAGAASGPLSSVGSAFSPPASAESSRILPSPVGAGFSPPAPTGSQEPTSRSSSDAIKGGLKPAPTQPTPSAPAQPTPSAPAQLPLSAPAQFLLEEEKRPGEFFPIEEDDRGTFIMNAKDLNMLAHLRALADAGVDSIKIEGRNKKAFYVATVVGAYRRVLDGEPPEAVAGELLAVSHRPYGTGFYFAEAEQASSYDGYEQETMHVADVVACEPAAAGRAGHAGHAPEGRPAMSPIAAERQGHGPCPTEPPQAPAYPEQLCHPEQVQPPLCHPERAQRVEGSQEAPEPDHHYLYVLCRNRFAERDGLEILAPRRPAQPLVVRDLRWLSTFGPDNHDEDAPSTPEEALVRAADADWEPVAVANRSCNLYRIAADGPVPPGSFLRTRTFRRSARHEPKETRS